MKLILNKHRQSLTPFSIELPDFTILTGVNGAGKTHLLKAILEGFVEVDNEWQEKERFEKVFIHSNILDSTPSSTFARIKVNEFKDKIINDFERFLEGKRDNPEARIETFAHNSEILHDIANKVGKKAEKLTVEEILANFPLFNDFNPIKHIPNMFFQDYSTLFKRYYDIYEENLYRKFLLETRGYKRGEYYSEEKFINKYGEPPWILLNKIINAANLGFSVIIPQNFHRDAPFKFLLINDLTKREVSITALSSGEKVIMSLAFALYNFNFDIKLPYLILMDEPTASLHPSMAKQFLNVIENIFVKDKGIKVIMTTHSPSTVALAPENSLYIMNKTAPRIEGTSKDKALKILTIGVPSLSINYENRKQIVVESKIDEFFYGKLYEKLKDKLESEISLAFIASSTHKNNDEGEQGGFSEVKKLVKIFRRNGNRSIFGIIDWDNRNSGNEGIIVFGEGKRYSIENYIFDPLLIAAYLLREKYISRQSLNLFGNETYTDFKNLSQSQLQTISDFITNKIQPFINPTDKARTNVRYINGIEIEIPQWYLAHQGHNLEIYLKDAFQQLKDLKKGRELKKEIINKVIDDVPELIPFDVLELFEIIQNL